MTCRECHCEYSDSDAESPEFYCSDVCQKKSSERVMEYQIKYSEAGRCRDTFENNRMRGKY